MTINNQINLFRSRLTILFLPLLLISFGICLYPEKPAQLLTNPDQTLVVGSEKSKINVNDMAQQYRQLRQSALEPAGYLFRNWTSDVGIGPLKIQSNTFTPSKYMSIIVAGSTRTLHGLVKTYIECEKNGARIEIFNGSVNVNISEALVATPTNWCSEGAHLIFETSETDAYVGVGAVYEISPISYWKSSFIGKLPYFFTALFIFSFLMFTGAATAHRYGWHHDPLPIAFVSLGITSLVIFYLSTGLNGKLLWISPIVIASISIYLFCSAGTQARKITATRLLPYFKIWALISLVYFAILSLAYNGLGHWEPNYRFWPAAWSSDSELPWLFTEATRHGWGLRELFGGQWMPTDRPPLMAGSLLLVSDTFELLQSNNDGNYFRGNAYNVASITLNTLWAPAILWLLTKVTFFLNRNQFSNILLFLACIPFVLFNSVYGWPKAFGASFALIAFGLVWLSRTTPIQNSILILFPITCALSMLAHMSGTFFIAPLGILYLLWNFQRKNLSHIIVGGSIALLLLASWTLYKHIILPSSDPVTKFALTGSFGFGNDSSTWKMLVERYQTIDVWQWLEIKRIMFSQAFYPIDHMITSAPINSDYGASSIDRLRALDFMLLTVGNAGIVICSILALWVICSSVRNVTDNTIELIKPFIILLLASLLTWLMIVILFIAPSVLHHWPQAAIFGLALGGSVITQYCYPELFKCLLLVSITYTGTVWIIAPLQNALTIDVSAAMLLVGLLGFAFLYGKSSLFSFQE